MAHLLVTGFEPFGGDAANPSGDAARALHGEWLDGHRVHGVVLPCTFATAPLALQSAIAASRPVAVLCLGLAASRRGFHPERVAINLVDARIPDNAGAQPIDEPVRAGGPAARFTRLPVKAVVAALQAAGHEAAVSHTAGTYVCNQVFYRLMQLLARRPSVRGGFMHVGGDLEADAVAAGTRVALRATLATAEDLPVGGGTLD